MAYEEAINETACPDAPWYVIPADDKKNMRIIVSNIIRQEMEALPMEYPQVSDERRAELQGYRDGLMGTES